MSKVFQIFIIALEVVNTKIISSGTKVYKNKYSNSFIVEYYHIGDDRDYGDSSNKLISKVVVRMVVTMVRSLVVRFVSVIIPIIIIIVVVVVVITIITIVVDIIL